MSVNAPATVPASGARCAAHPESAADATCTRCGSFYCESCAGYQFGAERFCVRCDPGGEYVAWEDRRRLGTWTAFLRTLKSLLLGPDRFFQRMPAHGGFGGPLLFAWISWLLAVGMVFIIYAVIVGGMFAILPFPPDAAGEQGPTAPIIVGIALAVMGCLALGIVPALFVWSLLLHLFAKIFGGAASYEATFRCHAYASGALALGIIPFIGMTAGEVYWVVLSIFAVKHAHKVSTGRAVAIVLTIPLLCCGLYFVSVFGLAALGSAAR
ncbi:MAG: YIP1 family protein [Deltaproteobacteria bacterium]|nr:YIP1 family protein [Deltaproteobacteria bacterium]